MSLTRSHSMRALVVIAAVVVAAACSKAEQPPPPPRDAAQQRKVDSTIGASRLPGAGGVRNALAASDSATKRKALLDSLAQNP